MNHYNLVPLNLTIYKKNNLFLMSRVQLTIQLINISAAKVQEIYNLSAQTEIKKNDLMYYFEVNMQKQNH